MGQETQKIQNEEKQEKKKRRISWFWLFFIPAALTGMGLGIYFGTKEDYSNSQINTEINPDPGTGSGGSGGTGGLLPPDTSQVTIVTTDVPNDDPLLNIKFEDIGSETWLKLPADTKVTEQNIKDLITASDGGAVTYTVNGIYANTPPSGTNGICSITATYDLDNNISKTVKVLVDNKAPTVTMAPGASLTYTTDIDTSHIADGYIEIGKNNPIDPTTEFRSSIWKMLAPADDGMGIDTINSPPMSYGIQQNGKTYNSWRDFDNEIKNGVVSGETYYYYKYVDKAGIPYIGKDGTVGFKVIVHIKQYDITLGGGLTSSPTTSVSG